MSTAVVDTISEALNAAADVDLEALSDRDLDGELVALLRLRHRLDAEIARRAARWDARTVWIGDGSKSPAARLSRDTGVSVAAAKATLRRGRAVTNMPRAHVAWAG